MNFYLDFEATQYSNEIISIGCVAENGKTFSTLVKPHKAKKLTTFITELTGMTKETLVDAPDANTAFNNFFDWVIKVSDNTVPKYFCYGDADENFIKCTIQHMTDIRAISFAGSIQTLLIDFAPLVAEYFCTNRIALKKVVALIEGVDAVEQKHDALEDAEMLRNVVEGLQAKCEKPINPTQQSQKTKVLLPIPSIYISWIGQKMWSANTLADETNYTIKCFQGSRIKYFDSIDTAVLWTIKYLRRGQTPKKQEYINQTKKGIEKSIRSETKGYCNVKWEKRTKQND